jgi:1-pyrroline-5-carboxylate dehydrogenase
VITPFNFPLEIPVLQLMGALYMGNKPLVKSDTKVSVVLEQFVRLMIACGTPPTDLDFIHCDGTTMNEILQKSKPKMTLFTGSQKVAHHLTKELEGNVKLEDAGFDWKILGPDVDDVDYVAHVSDQDAYACSGQKCSAQSILFMHDNWVDAGIEKKIAGLASQRSLEDLTVGPVLTLTTKTMLDHAAKLAALPGARVAFGGRELNGGDHSIPPQYGAIEPTAVYVPLKTIMASEENFKLVTTEIFGPLQVLTSYGDDDLPLVLEACEKMDAHLTAAVVSSDELFVQKVLGSTVNGTTYAGRRARTTGAPQNHWFGPAGTPMAGGIGTIEAIRLVWSCHREVIYDKGPVEPNWVTPPRA